MKIYVVVERQSNGRVTVTVDGGGDPSLAQLELESVQGAVRHLQSLNPRCTYARMTWWEET